MAGFTLGRGQSNKDPVPIHGRDVSTNWWGPQEPMPARGAGCSKEIPLPLTHRLLKEHGCKLHHINRFCASRIQRRPAAFTRSSVHVVGALSTLHLRHLKLYTYFNQKF